MDGKLLLEWNYERNTLDPLKIKNRSNKKVWWICKEGHEWEARPNDRNRNGCPYCSNKKVCLYNCLATTHPDLVREWSSKNILSPYQITYGSDKKIWWVCVKDHEWQSSVSNRTGNKRGCPYCSGNKVCKENSLGALYPELLTEWSEKNSITIFEITPGSTKEVWWKCKNSHEWKTPVYSRTGKIKAGCPYCRYGGKFCPEKSFGVIHPELLEEWDYEKNVVNPFEISSGLTVKIWWKCKNNPNHQWCCKLNSRTSSNNKCPVCKQSKGEKEIEELLKVKHLKYEREYRFDDCRHKRPLPFDFAILNKDTLIGLIEYQGRQHFEAIDFGKGLSNLKLQQKLDKIKYDYCQKNNISLLRIKYSEVVKETIEQWHKTLEINNRNGNEI